LKIITVDEVAGAFRDDVALDRTLSYADVIPIIDTRRNPSR
jgi:hypothetical protein